MVDKLLQCVCCQSPATFIAGSSPCCGRHLAIMIRQEAKFCGGSCTVTVEATAKAAALAKLPKKMTEGQLGELEDEFAGWEDSGTTDAIEI